MPQTNALASQISIKIDGSTLAADAMAAVLTVTVDQHAHLPDMFSISLQDPEMERIDNGPFDLAKEVEIAAETGDGTEITLMKGEITALEPEFQEGMIPRLVVRGYDKSHRLYRENKSTAHLNKKDSDLAGEIAQNAGLQVDVETTRTVYDHIFQHNQSDLAFLMQRAWRIGFECYVEDGKLVFRKPPTSGNDVELAWGQDLLEFLPRMTLAEQVDEVVVRGWDAEQQSAIVGRASQGSLYPEIEESRDGKTWAGQFGTGKTIITNQPVTSQAEADAIAEARLSEISGAFVQAEGKALRRPDIRAGKRIKLTGLGNRFSGTYLVTAATHVYSPAGLHTWFKVKGSRTGLISEELGLQGKDERWYGVVTAVVTNTDDPEDQGRIKVKYPWLTEDAESFWARVASPGAGPEAGFICVPDVGDEVLVAFEHGDFDQPYVLGGLWNGQHAPPEETKGAGSGEKPQVRTWRSRAGHRIAFYDNADEKIEIISKGGNEIVVDDANGKIVIKGSSLTLTFDTNAGKITLESGSEIEIKAGSNLKIEAGGNMDLTASGQVNVTGAMINLN